MRPEAARERDLHRYYTPWKHNTQNSLIDVKPAEEGDGLTYEGYKARASGDKTLTAFAQLAALRLNVRRAMVSLIDSAQQYILAEATQTLSLVNDDRHKPGDGVWLGNTILKRNDAVCHHCFGERYTALAPDGQTYTAEALVVPDMRLDERFRDRDYVKQKPGVTFYAGVPIKTKSGHQIGVYAVSDENARAGLSIDEVIFMEDAAKAVMEHLELAKDRDARMNGERMVQGLADFIEGTEEAGDTAGSAEAIAVNTSAEDQTLSPRISAVHRKQSENAQKMLDDLDGIVRSPVSEKSGNDLALSRQPSTAPKTRPSRDDPSRILGRAAKIIRQSTQADGVIFFNTNCQGVGRRASKLDGTDLSSGLNSGSDRSGDSTMQSQHPFVDSTDSSEELRTQKPNRKPRRTLCEVVGLAISQHEQYGRLEAKDFGFPEESMEKYIKSFPYGKFFSFTDTGSGISSGDELSSEDKPLDGNATSDKRPSNARPDTQARNKKERFVPSELLKVLPGIRSLIFLPLWDFMEGRYIAGGFIWTSTQGRLMSPENELPYLKAFGNSIMSEISRVKATKSSLAKTTFIASISHELRSPLHGILGSVEFLHETAVSSYQAGLFGSIETCGKTLLDTIDHVLDYAKINKLRNSSAAKRRTYARAGQKRDQVGSIVGLTTEFDLATLVEEAVDAVTAGHVFRKSHQGARHDQDIYGVSLSGIEPVERSDAGAKAVLDPFVILDITPRRNWFVRTQPGALRRIVMNLLGNALKYTDVGFVSVSLQVESETAQHLKVRLRFADSGKGMSLEFQRTKLYSPFSQEDPFATGTGLGLSIVRQIVNTLDGNILVSSTQHVGTEIEVVLTLPAAQKPLETQSIAESAATKGTAMCLIDSKKLMSKARPPIRRAEMEGLGYLEDALQEVCNGWLEMDVRDTSSQAVPEFILLPITPDSAEELIECCKGDVDSKVTAPVIALCSNAGQASEFRATIAGQLLERGIQAIPVTQPLGPRKLASVMEKFREDQIRQKQRIVLGRKESDPEVIRREMSVLRKAQEDYRAAQQQQQQQQDSVKLPSSSPSPQGQAREQGPRRPGPSALINVETAGDHSSDASSHQRSMSAPPAGPLPAMPTILTATSVPHRGNLGGSPRLHILLVDDNEINLQLLVMFMKKQKLTYATASNGLLALEAYQSSFIPSSPPYISSKRAGSVTPAAAAAADSPAALAAETSSTRHLSRSSPPFSHILMDLSMPVMDGLTSTRKIRAFEAEKGIEPSTIIALTGLASAEAQDDALSAGITEFLVKPVKFGELKGLLKDPSGT